MNFESPSSQPIVNEQAQPNPEVDKLRELIHSGSEQIEDIKTSMHYLKLIGASADIFLHQLECLDHEATSKDDSDYKYKNALHEIDEINKLFAHFPDNRVTL